LAEPRTSAGANVSGLTLPTLPETLARERRNNEPLTRAMANYLLLIRRNRLMGYAGRTPVF
jgi:hypothetical protein